MKQGSGSVAFGISLLLPLFLATGSPPSAPLGLSNHAPPWQQVPIQQWAQIDEDQIWKGSVTFTDLGARSFDRDNSNGRKIDRETLKRTITGTVEVHACGTMSELHATGISKHLEDTETYHKNVRVPVPRCADEDPDTYIEGRYDIDESERNVTQRFYDTLPPSDVRKFGNGPPAAIRFGIIPPNRYRFVVDAAIYTVMEGHTSSTKTRVCQDETETYRKNVRIAPWGTQPEPTVTETDNGRVETVYMPPAPYVAVRGFMGMGEWTPKGFAGRETPVNQDAKRPGDLARTIQVSWQFEPKGDACTDAYDLLYQDLAWAEAYANSDLADGAGNLADFKKLVGQQAYENYGSWLPPDMMGASVAMSVDPKDCSLNGFENAEERVERQCLPKVIYEAVLTHELEHVRQCQTQGDAFRDTGDFRSFGRFEVEAHLKGINYLKNYVEDHCQESGNLYNLYDVENRIAQLEAWLGQ